MSGGYERKPGSGGAGGGSDLHADLTDTDTEGHPIVAVAGLQAALDAKLAKAGGTMTGALVLPGDAVSALHATPLQQVQALIAALVNGAPGTLDALNELAAALGNDPNFATTMATALAGKVALGGSTSTGEQVAPSFKASGKTGATATPITLAGGTASGAPTSGAHIKGEVVVDDLGRAWYCTVAGTPGTWVLASVMPLLHVRDEKASGTAGGTFTSGAWQKRDLNTILTNELGAELTSNEVTGVPAGVYEVIASGACYAGKRHQCRLYNVTGAAALVLGTNEYGDLTQPSTCRSFVVGRFTLAATSTLRLEHRCESTFATNGYGLAGSWGVEVYAELQLRKVS